MERMKTKSPQMLQKYFTDRLTELHQVNKNMKVNLWEEGFVQPPHCLASALSLPHYLPHPSLLTLFWPLGTS